MTVTAQAFSDLIATVHQEGVEQALAGFPEIAQHREALLKLEQAEQDRARLEDLEVQASANVDRVELELRQLVVVES